MAIAKRSRVMYFFVICDYTLLVYSKRRKIFPRNLTLAASEAKAVNFGISPAIV